MATAQMATLLLFDYGVYTDLNPLVLITLIWALERDQPSWAPWKVADPAPSLSAQEVALR